MTVSYPRSPVASWPHDGERTKRRTTPATATMRKDGTARRENKCASFFLRDTPSRVRFPSSYFPRRYTTRDDRGCRKQPAETRRRFRDRFAHETIVDRDVSPVSERSEAFRSTTLRLRLDRAFLGAAMTIPWTNWIRTSLDKMSFASDAQKRDRTWRSSLEREPYVLGTIVHGIVPGWFLKLRVLPLPDSRRNICVPRISSRGKDEDGFEVETIRW